MCDWQEPELAGKRMLKCPFRRRLPLAFYELRRIDAIQVVEVRDPVDVSMIHRAFLLHDAH